MSNTLKARKAFRPDLMLPAYTQAAVAKKGMNLVDLKSLGFIPSPFAGGARGYHAQSDILKTTADNVDLNQLWDEYQETLNLWNQQRSTLINFLSYNVTVSAEQIFQGGDLATFQKATEFGEPVGYRPAGEAKFLGYTFDWYDLAARFTWMFLADAPETQVSQTNNMALEADNRLVFLEVMKTLFNNGRRTNKEGNVVFPFYSGVTTGDMPDDPPDYKNVAFANGHNHFFTTNNATLTAAHVESLQNSITEHGYSQTEGYALVLMVNEAQGNVIRNWRSLANGGVAGSATGGGLYDFVPAQGTASFLLPTTLRTDQEGATRPPSSIQGLTVIGSYGQFLIVQEGYIPAGYLVAFATGGPENIRNPIAVREHAQASLRGLRLVKGRDPDYPLIDSFYNHGLGTGIRYRGAGAILQVKVGTTYDIPPAYAWSAS